jgi:hypothetical protein
VALICVGVALLSCCGVAARDAAVHLCSSRIIGVAPIFEPRLRL